MYRYNLVMGDGKDFLRLYRNALNNKKRHDFQNTDDVSVDIGYEGYE